MLVGDTAKVDTLAPTGHAGTWLLDPEDFVIASSGGDMTGATLTSNLSTGNVTILSSSGTTNPGGTGSIYVDDNVSWSANLLTLTVADNVVVGANAAGVFDFCGDDSDRYVRCHHQHRHRQRWREAAVFGGSLSMAVLPTAAASPGRSIIPPAARQLVSNAGEYTVITSLGARGQYLPAPTCRASTATSPAITRQRNRHRRSPPTSGWNSGDGFTPLGNSSTNFTGVFEGFGHTISNLTINSFSNYVGLFGYTGNGSSINDVGVAGGSVTSSSYVGELVGENNGTVSNSYATGTASHRRLRIYQRAGGVERKYDQQQLSATGSVGSVGGNEYVGGLVGVNHGPINNSYATGSVSGSFLLSAGWLGETQSRRLTTATPPVRSPVALMLSAGWLGKTQARLTTATPRERSPAAPAAPTSAGWWGENDSGGTVSNGFLEYNHLRSILQPLAGRARRRSADRMQTLAKQFASGGAGWSISSSNPDNTTTWYINPGSTYPLLRTPPPPTCLFNSHLQLLDGSARLHRLEPAGQLEQ